MTNKEREKERKQINISYQKKKSEVLRVAAKQI